jgi:hypothetical protein
MSAETLAPIRRAILVQAPLEHAFRTFTDEIGSWWPVHTHSIGVMQDGSGAPVDVVMEPRVDGDLGEVAADGARKSWGRVLGPGTDAGRARWEGRASAPARLSGVAASACSPPPTRSARTASPSPPRASGEAARRASPGSASGRWT